MRSRTDEKPGPAIEDRLRERFAHQRHLFRTSVLQFDSEWESPTDPDGIIPRIKTMHPPKDATPSKKVSFHIATALRLLLLIITTCLLTYFGTKAFL